MRAKRIGWIETALNKKCNGDLSLVLLGTYRFIVTTNAECSAERALFWCGRWLIACTAKHLWRSKPFVFAFVAFLYVGGGGMYETIVHRSVLSIHSLNQPPTVVIDGCVLVLGFSAFFLFGTYRKPSRAMIACKSFYIYVKPDMM